MELSTEVRCTYGVMHSFGKGEGREIGPLLRYLGQAFLQVRLNKREKGPPLNQRTLACLAGARNRYGSGVVAMNITIPFDPPEEWERRAGIM